jgi:NAD-dependent deacetylase sirtuin 5
MWRKYESTSIATPEAFEESPSRVWQFYHYRREKCVLPILNAILTRARQCSRVYLIPL